MRPTALLLPLLAVTAVGCGADADEAPTASATPAAATVAAAAPTAGPGISGAWAREVTAADKRAAGAVPDGPPAGLPTGRATLRVDVPETLSIVLADGGFEQVRLEDVAKEGATVDSTGFCVRPRPAPYAFVLRGDRLTVRTTADACADRRATLVGTWRSVP